MNFFDAPVQKVQDDRVRIDAGPLGNLTASPRDLAFSVGQNSLAAIRPEKIRISSNKPTDGNVVEGTMDAASYLGDRSYYYVRVVGVEKSVAVSVQNLDPDQFSGEIPQGRIWLSWSNNAIVLLNVD
jgi:ABC-type Fe3+/spermidine/putrescine transport system ATPase subunit